jgi:hypothetical protein
MKDYTIKILSITDLFELLDLTKNDIHNLQEQASKLLNKKERIATLNLAVVKYELYEKLYYIYQRRVRKKMEDKNSLKILLNTILLSRSTVNYDNICRVHQINYCRN